MTLLQKDEPTVIGNFDIARNNASALRGKGDPTNAKYPYPVSLVRFAVGSGKGVGQDGLDLPLPVVLGHEFVHVMDMQDNDFESADITYDKTSHDPAQLERNSRTQRFETRAVQGEHQISQEFDPGIPLRDHYGRVDVTTIPDTPLDSLGPITDEEVAEWFKSAIQGFGKHGPQ